MPRTDTAARKPSAFFALLFLTLTACLAGQVKADDDTPKCHMQNYATLALEQDHGQELVQGEMNGMPARFALDTGAYRTQLVPGSVDKFHLAQGHTDRTAFGVSGEAREYYARLDSFSIGDFKAGRRDLIVMGSMAGTPRFDGLVGTDVLFEHDLELDVPENKARLFRPLHCESRHLAYWDDKAPWIEMQKMTAYTQAEVVTVEVNGHKLRALLDSGAYRTTMTLEAAAALGITPDSPGVVAKGSSGGTGTVKHANWQAPFERIVIGAESVEHPNILIADIWGAAERDTHGQLSADNQPDMLLGGDFFRTHRVLFSETQRRLYYSYTGGQVFGSDAVTVTVAQAQ